MVIFDPALFRQQRPQFANPDKYSDAFCKTALMKLRLFAQIKKARLFLTIQIGKYMTGRYYYTCLPAILQHLLHLDRLAALQVPQKVQYLQVFMWSRKKVLHGLLKPSAVILTGKWCKSINWVEYLLMAGKIISTG